jgi:hypothetical protein
VIGYKKEVTEKERKIEIDRRFKFLFLQ